MRLDRPIGIWLLLLPGLWSILLASGGILGITVQALYYCFLFFIGATIMRGAGCVINDIWDRDIDKHVERTQGRPIACGDVSVMHAVIFLLILLSIGFVILLQFNTATVILGVLSIPLIGLYPLMKRITWWPQLFLGLTFNFGALMGWTAITGYFSLPMIILYIGAIFWTLGYDTIYAHQDKDDDAMIGVKSTAIILGDDSKHWVAKFYGLSALFFISAHLMQGADLSLVLIIPALILLGKQIMQWDLHSQESALETFKSNQTVGWAILVSFLV